jgi:hypothetical protein
MSSPWTHFKNRECEFLWASVASSTLTRLSSARGIQIERCHMLDGAPITLHYQAFKKDEIFNNFGCPSKAEKGGHYNKKQQVRQAD